MGDKQQTKNFATKLSLPKFIAMVKRLTPEQKELVSQMGFKHLLELRCQFLPRGVIHWLAVNFDVSSRSFDLPNGFRFTITPFCIHQVLGTPLGGARIGRKVDPKLRILIAQQTKCKDNYPTIAELDQLITPDLDEEVFKRVFAMYALTAILCPSSHGAVSPSYYHVLEDPDKIGSFDYSSAVLDKLVCSIDSYNGGETSVLGGNLLTLAIIHFEFLDTDIMQVSSKWPRISLWTSEIVAEYERRDCISSEKLLYGRLPTKHVSQTPFSRCNNHDKFPLSSSYEELLQFVLSVTPEGNQKRVMDDLPSIIDIMQRDMFDAMQPVILKSLVSLLKIMPSRQILATGGSPKMDACHEVAPKLSGEQQAPDLPLIAPSFNRETQSAMKNGKVSWLDCIKGQQPGPQTGAYGAPPVVNLYFEPEHLEDITFPEFFMFQEPSNKVLARWDEKACGNTSIRPYIQDIVKGISSVKLSTELDIPYYPELLESMIPQKILAESCDLETPPTLNLLSYMLEDDVFWEQRKQDTWEHHSKCLKVVDQLEGFDISSSVGCSDASTNPSRPTSPGETGKQHKRSTCLSLNEMAANCIALKKRARMFEWNSELADHPSTPLREPLSNSEDVNLSPHTPAHAKIFHANNDFPWDNQELVAELIESSDRIADEYYSQKRQSQFTAPVREGTHTSEVTPGNFCCTFVSTPVEKEVFGDIVARVPQTTKQRTIKIVQMGTTWVEHRVFALSMQVYGRVIKYVINMMGKAVIVELIEKKKLDLLPHGYWSKYYMECDIAALFQKSFENPGSLCAHLRNDMLGFMLDTIDMVHMPLSTSGFWYLIVANFRKKLFEVLYPNNKIHLIVDEANRTINNFKGAFNIAYRHSNIRVAEMPTSFRSVCSSTKEADSGIFTMKLIQSHDGDTTLCFQPEHAKSLRESLCYYMLAHPFNERLPPETKAILRKHGIAYDYTTPGYFPWGH